MLSKNTSGTPAGVEKRIAAFFIDIFIVYIFIALFSKILPNISSVREETSKIRESINNGILLGFYYIIFSSFIFKGQSIGKKVMNIKVVKENDENIDLLVLLNREILAKIFIEKANLWMLLIMSETGILQKIISQINSKNISSLIWYLISLPWIMFISFAMMVNNKDHESLHDIISKAKVVNK